MTAFPGSFGYRELLNLDERDIVFWTQRAVRSILNRRLNDLVTARVGSGLDGKFWSEQVNHLLGIKKEFDLEDGDMKKIPAKQASGWGYFEMNKTG